MNETPTVRAGGSETRCHRAMMRSPRGAEGTKSRLAALLTLGVLVSSARGVAALPDGLSTPDPRVVCNTAQAICYDRLGPSIGLTQVYLGREAADRLTTALRGPPASGPETSFSPAPGVECRRATGPCRIAGKVDTELTALLFGPWPATGNADALLGVDWKWLASRYPDGSVVTPPDPSHYTLHFTSDGLVKLRVDCNRAGGRYRLDAPRLAIEVMHSTRAACGPQSLESVFLRDLARTDTAVIRDARLYIELRDPGGRMEFGP